MDNDSLPKSFRGYKGCSVQGCENQHYSKSFCCKHYNRYRYHGNALYLHPRYGAGETEEDRFWSRLIKSDDPKGCWEHQQRSGRYATASYKGTPWLAHRLSFFLAYGREPQLQILHICDNGKCVRPDHLREGTQAENMADMVAKDRQLKGSKNPASKLVETEVRQIKHRLSDGASLLELAIEFHVSFHCISKIKTGKNWGHIN